MLKELKILFQGSKNCITEDCIMRGQNFKDPYFSSYNIERAEAFIIAFHAYRTRDKAL